MEAERRCVEIFQIELEILGVSITQEETVRSAG